MAATGPADAADPDDSPDMGDGEAEEDEALPVTTSGRDAEAALTDEQLMEIFKQTSIFNVRSAMANNDALMAAHQSGDHEER
jgi:hypothetical protein